MSKIKDNIEIVKNNIKEAAYRANRKPEDITLVCVTKTVDVGSMKRALECNIHHIGESRVQAAQEKFEHLDIPCTKHLIGTLQRNKVNKALELFDMIQSVDRKSLVKAIGKRASDKIDVLLQVNVAKEKSKHGITPENLFELAETASQYDNINVCGLMTMAPFVENPEDVRYVFANLRELAEKMSDFKLPNIKGEILSMGMTNDYEVAVEEGATHVRVGSAIFSSE